MNVLQCVWSAVCVAGPGGGRTTGTALTSAAMSVNYTCGRWVRLPHHVPVEIASEVSRSKKSSHGICSRDLDSRKTGCAAARRNLPRTCQYLISRSLLGTIHHSSSSIGDTHIDNASIVSSEERLVATQWDVLTISPDGRAMVP